MKNKKVKSINSDLFKVIDKDSLSNLGNIIGGATTKSGSTGWVCKDDKDGADAGPWTPPSASS